MDGLKAIYKDSENASAGAKTLNLLKFQTTYEKLSEKHECKQLNG